MSLPDETVLPAPYLLWPTAPLVAPPPIPIPAGYTLRAYRAGDEQAWYPLFAQEGWSMTDAGWQRICAQLGWPYTPEHWPTGIG